MNDIITLNPDIKMPPSMAQYLKVDSMTEEESFAVRYCYERGFQEGKLWMADRAIEIINGNGDKKCKQQ